MERSGGLGHGSKRRNHVYVEVVGGTTVHPGASATRSTSSGCLTSPEMAHCFADQGHYAVVISGPVHLEHKLGDCLVASLELRPGLIGLLIHIAAFAIADLPATSPSAQQNSVMGRHR